MKIYQRVQEIWSRHESVTDGRTDEGHSYNPPFALQRGIIDCIRFPNFDELNDFFQNSTGPWSQLPDANGLNSDQTTPKGAV